MNQTADTFNVYWNANEICMECNLEQVESITMELHDEISILVDWMYGKWQKDMLIDAVVCRRRRNNRESVLIGEQYQAISNINLLKLYWSTYWQSHSMRYERCVQFYRADEFRSNKWTAGREHVNRSNHQWMRTYKKITALYRSNALWTENCPLIKYWNTEHWT